MDLKTKFKTSGQPLHIYWLMFRLVFFSVVWLIDHSDPNGVEYFRKLLNSNIKLVILGEYPNPPLPSTKILTLATVSKTYS